MKPENTPTELAIHHLRIQRTARYCSLGGAADGFSDVRSVWYVLHGYRQLADRFIRRFESIASPTRLVVAPEALNRFYLEDDDGLKRHGPDSPVGATWMTRHDRETEIEDYVAYLDRLDRTLRLGRGVRRIVVGFSQGAATAARWALLGKRRVHGLVLWAGALPHDVDPAAHVRRLRVLTPVFVCGAADRSLSVTAVEGEAKRLREMRVDAAVLHHAGGHEVDAATVERLAHQLDPEPDA